MADSDDARRIELLATLRARGDAGGQSPDDLVHELQVHQVELEMQNRALREAQQLLEESRSRYADLYDFAPVGYCTLDASGLVLEVNLVGAAMLGVERGRLVGRPLSRMLGADEARVVRGHLHRCAAARGRVESEVVLGVGRAPRTVVQMVSVPHEAAGGSTTFRTVLSDVTALTQARREAREAAEEARRERARAEDANRSKDEFLAVVSHELRTPLTSILGWSRMLRADPSPPERLARGLETIERNAQTQAQLTSELLDMARILTGKVALGVVGVDLAHELAVALDSLRPAAEARSVRLVGPADGARAMMEGDPDRLQQVLTNLLGNALKFTPPGGEVEASLRVDGEVVEVTVRDTGVGIEAAFLPHVFERFRQGHGGAARAFGGLGLGLAIAKHLVECHGGSVEARSDGAGRGATFHVTLPRGRAEARSVHPSATVQAARYDASVLDGLRVLVVEDDDDAREMFAVMLADRGASVTVAASVPEALAAFEAERPQVLVSDIGLPGEDGFALMRRVRALAPDAGGATPALAITAYARVEDRDRALRAGFSAHVTKPVEPEVLVAAVSRLAAPAARG